jgi:hypothetical protein
VRSATTAYVTLGNEVRCLGVEVREACDSQRFHRRSLDRVLSQFNPTRTPPQPTGATSFFTTYFKQNLRSPMRAACLAHFNSSILILSLTYMISFTLLLIHPLYFQILSRAIPSFLCKAAALAPSQPWSADTLRGG